MSCFCELNLTESTEHVRMNYSYVGSPSVKQYELQYYNQLTHAVVIISGIWTNVLSALTTKLTAGEINQNQYDCALIQYHYIDGDDNAREMIRRFTDVYDRTENGNIFKMLYLPGEQVGMKQIDLLRNINSHFVSCAVGDSLDSIARLLNLSRETSETDVQFRARILAKIPGFIGGGTIPSIKQAVSTFLGIPESAIYVEDGYPVAAAFGHFRVSIDIGVAPGVGQTYTRMVELINEIKAVGTVLDSTGFRISEHVHISETISFVIERNLIEETLSVSENSVVSMFVHRASITYTDSLNVVQ